MPLSCKLLHVTIRKLESIETPFSCSLYTNCILVEVFVFVVFFFPVNYYTQRFILTVKLIPESITCWSVFEGFFLTLSEFPLGKFCWAYQERDSKNTRLPQDHFTDCSKAKMEDFEGKCYAVSHFFPSYTVGV